MTHFIHFQTFPKIPKSESTGTVVASMLYSIAFASHSKKNYDVTEA